MLTGGEVSDYKGYLPIMEAEGPVPKVLLADKGYDADFIRDDMEQRGGYAMIPTKRNRRIQLPVASSFQSMAPSTHCATSSSAVLTNSKMPDDWQHDTTKPHSAIQASSISFQFDCG